MGKKNCVSTRLADDYRTLDVKYCTEKFDLKKNDVEIGAMYFTITNFPIRGKVLH